MASIGSAELLIIGLAALVGVAIAVAAVAIYAATRKSKQE